MYALVTCKYKRDQIKDQEKMKINRIYDGVEAETRESQASFQIIQISSEALRRMIIK